MTKLAGARDPALNRAANSTVESRRPICPHCQQRMPHPRSPKWSGWLEPWSHRRPDGEPCPGFKKLEPLAPPPPLAQPASAPPRAAQAPAIRIDVTEWWAWFEQAAANTQAPTRTRRPRATPRPADAGTVQLQLFTADGRVWCELYPAPSGLRLVSENCQDSGGWAQNQMGMFGPMTGVECGRG